MLLRWIIVCILYCINGLNSRLAFIVACLHMCSHAYTPWFTMSINLQPVFRTQYFSLSFSHPNNHNKIAIWSKEMCKNWTLIHFFTAKGYKEVVDRSRLCWSNRGTAWRFLLLVLVVESVVVVARPVQLLILPHHSPLLYYCGHIIYLIGEALHLLSNRCAGVGFIFES